MEAAIPTTRRPVIDVSALPDSAWDSQSPLWWGNLLMTLIETTTVVLMLASYYYVRRNYDVWPPPRPDNPVIIQSHPDKTYATMNLALLVLSCIPMYVTDMAARAKQKTGVMIGLTGMMLFAAISMWLHFREFPGLRFWWNDNAYASIIWSTIGLHIFYVAGAIGEFFIMWLWLMGHDIDEKHALDVTLAGGYWYWVAGIWIPIYVTIWFGPHFL